MSVGKGLFEWIPIMYMDSNMFRELKNRGETWFGEEILCETVGGVEYCGAHLFNYRVITPPSSPEASMLISDLPVYTVFKWKHRLVLKHVSYSKFNCTYNYLLYAIFSFYKGGSRVQLCRVDNPSECVDEVESSVWVGDAPGSSNVAVEYYITEDKVLVVEMYGIKYYWRLTTDPDKMNILLKLDETRSSCVGDEQRLDLLLYFFEYSLSNPFAEYMGLMLDIMLVTMVFNIVLFVINMIREVLISPSHV